MRFCIGAGTVRSVHLLLLGFLLVPARSYSGGVGVSTPGMPTDSASLAGIQQGTCCDTFNVYRLNRPQFPVPNTDLEFLWSETYRFRYHQPQIADTTIENDLDRLGLVIAENVGNPYGLNAPDIRLLYDYFNWPGALRPATYDPSTQVRHHYLLGLITPSAAQYPEADDNHVDTYLYAPNTTRAGWQEIGAYAQTSDAGDGDATHTMATLNRGEALSEFESRVEDLSSGHRATGDTAIYHKNSLMVPGPRRGEIGFSSWTVAGGRPNWMWDHEFQHVMNKDAGPSADLQELWSSMAEAVAGELSDTPVFDAPYTWPLLYSNNYQAWRSFGSYLVSNFRNGTQVISDDLVYRWAHGSGQKDLAHLALRLRDGECTECQTLTYLAGDTSGIGRLGLIMHNWRVAQFADKYDFAEHQYGFGFNFHPVTDVGAFQNMDNVTNDDNVAIPPQFPIGATLRTRDTVLRVRPSIHDSPARPLSLTLLGSEYAVFRADPGLAATQQDLVLRVAADNIVRTAETLSGCVVFPSQGEVFASVITYSHDDTALFRHPEWLVGVTTQRILADKMRGDLEFVVGGFGGNPVKAAVLVVSLQDGPSGANSGTVGPGGTIPIHISAALRTTPYATPNPQLVQATSGYPDDWPAWSPAGTELAFEATIPSISGDEQIYRKTIGGGGPTPLSLASGLAQYAPDWSDRGDVIAYAQGMNPSGSSIYLYNVQTAGAATRISFLSGYARQPAIRPDGLAVAYLHNAPFSGQAELRLINLAPGAYFYDQPVADLPLANFDRAIRWAPDGMSVYFVRNDSLYSVSVYADIQQQLALTGGRSAFSMDISGDASHVVYERPDTAKATALSKCFALGCDCTFGYYNETDILRLLAVRNLGTAAWEPRFTTAGMQLFHPRYSLDGTRVAYSLGVGALSDRDLYVGTVSFDHAPTFTGLVNDYYPGACVPFALSLHATDSDGEAVSFSAALIPDGSELNGNIFRWDYPVVGDYNVVFRAKDGAGGVATRVVSLHVSDWGMCGGEMLAQGSGPSGWMFENSVLGPMGRGNVTEMLALRVPPQVFDGRTAVRLVSHGGVAGSVDQVGLIAVDHAPGTRVFRLSDRFVTALPIAANGVLTRDGTDVTVAATGHGGAALAVADGETLSVALGTAAGPLVVEARRPAGGSAARGITVQGRLSNGTWWTLRQLYPRGDYDRFVVDSVGSAVRLLIRGDNELRFVGRLAAGPDAPAVHQLDLRNAVSSRLGSVQSLLSAPDTMVAGFVSGDTMMASFSVPAPPANLQRDWFLLVKGQVTVSTPGASGPSTLRPARREELPTRFALEQNRPNPFTRSTTIHFTLPSDSPVRVEIFDLGGRRLRTLALGAFVTGPHSVEWDRRDDDGHMAHPGIYLYRLVAGSFVDQKKMVLME